MISGFSWSMRLACPSYHLLFPLIFSQDSGENIQKNLYLQVYKGSFVGHLLMKSISYDWMETWKISKESTILKSQSKFELEQTTRMLLKVCSKLSISNRTAIRIDSGKTLKWIQKGNFGLSDPVRISWYCLTIEKVNFIFKRFSGPFH